MNYLFYDTETTGLTRNDEVIQFAGFITDEGLSLKKFMNYYCYTQVPIHKDAENVHGISQSILWQLSGGKTFEDMFYGKQLHKYKDLIWVSYSKGGFDERLINQTLQNNGLPKYDFGSKLDYLGEVSSGVHQWNAYKALKKRCFNGRDMKLMHAFQRTGYKMEQLEKLFARVTRGNDKAIFHDALFDAFVLYLIVFRYRERLGLGMRPCEL